MALTAPRVRAGVKAVGMLTATSTVAIQAGVASSATPTVTLIGRQAGTGDHCPHLAAVGVLTAATMPLLAQVCHCAHTAVPFIAQAALTAVAHTAHGLGCTGRGAHGLQLQLHITAWPSPALIAEAGARAPETFIATPMWGTAACLALGSEGTRGTEFTRCPGKTRMTIALPTSAYAIQAHTVATAGASGTTGASMAVSAIVTRATARLPDGGDTFAVATPTHVVAVPKTRRYPGTSTHGYGVQRSCPELGVVTPAGLRAALLP